MSLTPMGVPPPRLSAVGKSSASRVAMSTSMTAAMVVEALSVDFLV